MTLRSTFLFYLISINESLIFRDRSSCTLILILSVSALSIFKENNYSTADTFELELSNEASHDFRSCNILFLSIQLL